MSQPFNAVATSTVRCLLSSTGLQSETVIKHLHPAGLVRSRLPNGRELQLWSQADDWVSNQIYWRGWDGYESETVPLFFRLAEHADVTLDIGAYVGFYSLLAAHANPCGRVFAFEPMLTIFKRLQKNVALNDLTNVECTASAVGALSGTATFFHTTSDMPTSSSLSFEFMREADNLQGTDVPVLTVDEFVAHKNLDQIDLVKIDTESTEPEVLQGMVKTLQRDHPSIVCEVLQGRGRAHGLETLLRPLGYNFYLLTPEGPMLQERIEGHSEWLNYLFSCLAPDEVKSL